MQFFRFLTALVVSIVASATLALAAPNVQLVLSQNVVVHTDGKVVVSAVPAEGAKYGSTLRYTVLATNRGNQPAIGVQPVGNIPHGFSYIAGTASPEAGAVFTLDGKTWSTKPTLKVRGADGKFVEKPASPELYRAIRWNVAKLLPKKSATFTYEVTVK